jgi:hypothetical protein
VYKTIFTILISLFLSGAAIAAPEESPQERLTASDGTHFELALPSTPTIVRLAPGESRRVGEMCESTKIDWVHRSTTCSWREMVTATEAGLIVTAGGSDMTEGLIVERILILIGVGLMVVSMALVLIEFAVAAAFAAVAAVAAAFAAAYAAAFAAAAFAAAFAAFAAAFAAAAESKKWFFIFVLAYTALMAAAFFMT